VIEQPEGSTQSTPKPVKWRNIEPVSSTALPQDQLPKDAPHMTS
jgi:hypothetical protein